MLEPRRGLYLLYEPFGAKHRGEFGTQHFHRDFAVVFKVVREIHGGHSAGTELALDLVAISKGITQALKGVRHNDVCSRPPVT